MEFIIIAFLLFLAVCIISVIFALGYKEADKKDKKRESKRYIGAVQQGNSNANNQSFYYSSDSSYDSSSSYD